MARERHATRRALSCFTQEQFRRIADEESVCLRIHSSEDASAKSEGVLLDVYVPRSAFAEDSDAVVESISDAFEAEVAISGRACAGTSRRTRLPFPCTDKSTLCHSYHSRVLRTVRFRTR